MTKEEAIQAMCEGKTLTHEYFTDKEWVKTNQAGTVYVFEDGVQCSYSEFWMWRTDNCYAHGWEIIK